MSWPVLIFWMVWFVTFGGYSTYLLIKGTNTLARIAYALTAAANAAGVILQATLIAQKLSS